MEIVFLCTSFPRYEGDGASVFLLNLVKALVHKGHRIHVIAPYDSRVDSDWKPKGIVFHRFRYSIGNVRLAYGAGIVPNLRKNPLLWLLVPSLLLAMAWKTWRVTRNYPIELIHAHWIIPAGVIATHLHRWHRLPVITTAHGSDIFSLDNRLWNYLRHRTLARSIAWTSNTVSTGEAAAARDISPANVIPMGVDCERIGSGNRKQGRGKLDDETFLILFVGRLIPLKGADILLKAFSMIGKTGDIKLWIAGDGPERSSLEHMSRDLGVKHRVRFLGSVDHDKLPNLYAAADVFVAPSKNIPGVGREGQGTVVLEAMAAGCCVIGSNCGGIPSLIEDGISGLLVEPDNETELADAIHNIMISSDKRRALGEVGRLRAKARYDWSTIAQEFDQLYGRLG